MGMGVVPVIGKILVGAIVSKVGTKVASKLGFSDSAASIIGAVGGIYAGANVFNPDPTAIAGSPSTAPPGVTSGAGEVAQQGMMSRGGAPDYLGDPGMMSDPGQVATPQPPPPPPPPPSDNWWDQIWNSDKTTDTLVGAAGGLARGYMEGRAIEDELKAEHDREDELSRRWHDYDINQFPSLAYPDKAKSGMLLRGQS